MFIRRGTTTKTAQKMEGSSQIFLRGGKKKGR